MHNQSSLLCLYKKLIPIRKKSEALRTGKTLILDTGSPAAAGYARVQADGECVAVFANLSNDAQSPSVGLAAFKRKKETRLTDLLAGRPGPAESGICSLELKPWEARIILIE